MTFVLAGRAAGPPIPQYFLRRLRSIDQHLICYWNPFKERFVVDRVTRDENGEQRTNVLIVENPDHSFCLPGDRILDEIKRMDAWTNFGGNDEAALLRMRAQHESAKAQHDENTRESAREAYKEAMLDDKPQLLKALHLMQQHDVARPHK